MVASVRSLHHDDNRSLISASDIFRLVLCIDYKGYQM